MAVGFAIASVLVIAEPARSTTAVVTTEAEYRAALASLSADDSGAHTVTLGADLTLDDGTDPLYTGSQDLTVDGDGHVIDAGGTGRILRQQDGGGGGAAVYVTLRDVTLTGGAAAGNGGAVLADNAVVLVGATLMANSATGSGGAVAAGWASVTNSTLVANTAGVGGAGVFGSSGMMVNHSTFTANSAPSGAQVFTYGDMNRFATVFTDPLGGGQNCRIGSYWDPVSDGWNWSTDASCKLNGPGDTVNGADPQLAPLADNGGPTPTRLPRPRSPLIDNIPLASCSATVTADQRGEARPYPTGGGCDTGSVERTPIGVHAYTVDTESAYRDALAALSFEVAQPGTITLSGDLTLAEGTDPRYTGGPALTIDGDGHRIDAASTSRALDAATTAAVTLVDVELTGGAAGGAGGAVRAAGPVQVQGSTLHTNSAGTSGGALQASAVTIEASTLTANEATGSGGATASTAGTTVLWSTIVGNSAPAAANVAATGNLTATGSVLADPLGGGANCTVGLTPSSGGHNWSDDTSCGLAGVGDEVVVDGDPVLAALGDAGGPTPTRFPEWDSPLRNRVPAAACPATDQRGTARPQPAGGACDTGAVEALPLTVAVVTPPDGAVYRRGESVTADYACADDPGAGTLTCVGPVADGAAVDTGTAGAQTFAVTGSDPTGDSVTVTHGYTVVTGRPDARVGRGTTGVLTGNDVYGTFTGQTRSGRTVVGGTVTYTVSVQNDAVFAERIRLRALGSTDRFRVRYRTATGTNVTRQVVAGTFRTPSLVPQATWRLRVEVTVLARAPVGASLTRDVKAFSTTHASIRDAVRTVTTRR